MSFQGILYGIVRTTVESALLNVSVDVTILTFKGVVSMLSSPVQIMAYAAALPEGALMHPKVLLHLGARAAIDQALSRLAKNGSLMRVCHGIYVCPVETRFGPRPACNREGARIAVGALGGDHSALRRHCGERPWTHHPDAGAVGLPDLRTASQADARGGDSEPAPCSPLATGSSTPTSRRGRSRIVLAGA